MEAMFFFPDSWFLVTVVVIDEEEGSFLVADLSLGFSFWDSSFMFTFWVGCDGSFSNGS